MSDATTAEVKKPVRIFENDLQREEFTRTCYILNTPVGSTISDYLEVEAFAHVGGKLRRHDRIELFCEDDSYWAELLVLTSGAKVRVELLRKNEFEADPEQAYEAYEANWGGPSAKHRVLRKSDRHVMIDKLASKSEAIAWIEKNAAPLAKAA